MIDGKANNYATKTFSSSSTFELIFSARCFPDDDFLCSRSLHFVWTWSCWSGVGIVLREIWVLPKFQVQMGKQNLFHIFVIIFARKMNQRSKKLKSFCRSNTKEESSDLQYPFHNNEDGGLDSQNSKDSYLQIKQHLKAKLFSFYSWRQTFKATLQK